MKSEKAKNAELQRLYDEQRAQNRNYMKDLSDREQMLEKIEFLNQVLQDKEQELLVVRGELPKKEKFYEENMKNLRVKHENQVKSLENDLESYSQQIERLSHMLDEKNELLTKVENLQDLVKTDQIKIKKMGQEINSFGAVSDENAQLKNL